ncbi:MAG: roadblock/LC7 domain-containing protein [Chitinivibrionales bacterium]|nr:roadblock/LC7 domain-containing protein [Chitinivibrionales bacterium]
MQKDLILSKEDIVRLNIVLTRIVDESRIDCALLINKSGRLVTVQSEGIEFDKTAAATLVASTFASTNSIASMIGEEEFTSIVQEGKDHHMYITLIDESTILSCIFDKRSNLEKVKERIELYLDHLRVILDKIYSNTPSSAELNFDIGHTR